MRDVGICPEVPGISLISYPCKSIKSVSLCSPSRNDKVVRCTDESRSDLFALVLVGFSPESSLSQEVWLVGFLWDKTGVNLCGSPPARFD